MRGQYNEIFVAHEISVLLPKIQFGFLQMYTSIKPNLVEEPPPRKAMESSAQYILSHPKSLSDFSLSFDWWNHTSLQESSETPEGSAGPENPPTLPPM
ncbi:hypothetical protein B4W72_02335 [Staphylococcus delphini]|nr:hypothetical protein B4W72_02335 [Staphylococcus delphini]